MSRNNNPKAVNVFRSVIHMKKKEKKSLIQHLSKVQNQQKRIHSCGHTH